MNLKFVIVVAIAVISSLMYRYHKQTNEMIDLREHEGLVENYFLGLNKMDKLKPILWIHAVGERNARNWQSFGSRSTDKLNQPYLYMFMKSISDKCTSFNVCLVDDTVFKYLPGWDLDVNALPSPKREKARQLGLTTLLYNHGGMLVPPSTLCLRDMLDMYKDGGDAFIVDGRNGADVRFMGCKRNSAGMGALMGRQRARLDSNTDAFEDSKSFFLEHFTMVCGKRIGVKTVDGVAVQLKDLLGSSPVKFHKNAYAIYVPADEVLANYSWFARMSTEQLVRSDMVISKQLLASY